MITITLVANPTIIDLLNVRLFLQKIHLHPKLEQEYVIQQIFYPFHKDFEKYIVNQSLTIKSIGKNDQIRFLLLQEIFKYWRIILKQILNQYEEINISIYQSQHLGDGSKLFFNLIAQNSKINLSYHPFQNPEKEASCFDDLQLTPEEKWILEVTQYPSMIDPVDQQRLFKHASYYLSVGDAWTSLNINYLLLPHQPEFFQKIWEDLGMAHNGLMQIYQAEFFTKKWLEVATGKGKGVAADVYAMILSRYHPPYFKDYEKAMIVIQNGCQYLQNLRKTASPEESLKIQYDEIFLSNGKSYILFKQKKYEEAIQILEEGIAFFDENPKLKRLMDYSLFVYNLALTYKQVGNHKLTVQNYEKLLELDPFDSLYYIDFAAYHVDLNDFDKAKELIDKALTITSDLPAAYAILGYIYLQQNDLNQSTLNYKKAFEILPDNIEYLYNYAYALSLQEEYNKIIDLLDENQWQWSDQKAWLKFSKSYYIDLLFLYVEALTYCNQTQQAIQMLKKADHKFTNHPQIGENLKLLENSLNNN